MYSAYIRNYRQKLQKIFAAIFSFQGSERNGVGVLLLLRPSLCSIEDFSSDPISCFWGHPYNLCCSVPSQRIFLALTDLRTNFIWGASENEGRLINAADIEKGGKQKQSSSGTQKIALSLKTLERKNFVSESWSRSSRVLVRANWHRKL